MYVYLRPILCDAFCLCCFLFFFSSEHDKSFWTPSRPLKGLQQKLVRLKSNPFGWTVFPRKEIWMTEGCGNWNSNGYVENQKGKRPFLRPNPRNNTVLNAVPPTTRSFVVHLSPPILNYDTVRLWKTATSFFFHHFIPSILCIENHAEKNHKISFLSIHWIKAKDYDTHQSRWFMEKVTRICHLKKKKKTEIASLKNKIRLFVIKHRTVGPYMNQFPLPAESISP